MYFLFLEFLGTTELMVIAFVALIIFGPRKLPELGRSLGKSLGEFKRASEDFKRTWEYEVEVERSAGRETRVEQEERVARNGLLESGAASASAEDSIGARLSTHDASGSAPAEQTIARASTGPVVLPDERDAVAHEGVEVSAPTRKQDWL